MTQGSHRVIDAIAKEALSLLGTGQQVTPFSLRYPGFRLVDAYEVVAVLREMRRARLHESCRVGRPGYLRPGLELHDSTVHELATVGEAFALKDLPEPRVEPDIVLHLASPPRVGMSEDQLSAQEWKRDGNALRRFPARRGTSRASAGFIQ
jgi:2-oxo-3-hexenedioate decarboxylase